MKTMKLVMAFFFLSLMFVGGAFAEDKIGYVNLSKLFDEYHKTKEYDKVLEAKSTDYQTERNKKVEKIKESQGKLDLLTDDKKAKLRDEIEAMKTDLGQYDRQKQGDLTKERNEKIREILLEIEKIVSDFAQKEHYTLILNDRVLIYGNESMDITKEILKVLNTDTPKK